MNIRTPLLALASALGLIALPVFGEAGSAKADLEDLVKRVSSKIQEGVREESAFTQELAEFDALLAKYAGQKSDDVAQIAVMKALLYIQVFDEGEKAIPILQKLKAEFPGTAPAERVDAFIAQIERDSRLAVGKMFPTFAVKDLEGKPLSLADYRGKVVLIDFWATWCGPCVAELPNVLAAYRQHHEAGFEIVGISLDSDRRKLESFIAENGMLWRQYFDGKAWKNELAQEYGINSIPATYLLDGNGTIVGRNLRGKALGEAVAAALRR